MKEKYILLGNGLNRCLKDSISWDDLLKQIAEENKVDYNSNLPMPLEFERILNKTLENRLDLIADKSSVIRNMKSRISETVLKCSLGGETIHHELKKIDVSGFLTTNYDYMIEKVFDEDYYYDGQKKSNKYLFEPTSVIENKKIFHIHGIAGIDNSLCLGYEHYMGLVEKERTAINTKKDNKRNEMLIKRILCGEERENDKFYEKFYTSDIAIVGLALDTCEVDLWWLLTHRAYLYNSNYAKLMSKGLLDNKIVYYDVILEKDDDENKVRKQNQLNKHSLLKDLHVEVKTYSINDKSQYEQAYKKILEDIRVSFSKS